MSMNFQIEVQRVTLLRNKHTMDKIYFHMSKRDVDRLYGERADLFKEASFRLEVPYNTGEKVLEKLDVPSDIIEFIAMSDG